MSKDYWIKRQTERETKAYSNILDIEKQYKLSLEQARANIEKEIRHIGTKYMRDNTLSFNEASKLLKRDEFKLWKKDLHEYMTEYKDLIKTKPLEAQKLWLEIETLSARSRMSHLDTLRTQIDKELIKVSVDVDEKITHELTSVYRDTYTEVVKDLGISKVVDKEKIKAVLDKPWSGANYSQRLWGNTEKLSQVLKQEVVNGMIQGINLNVMTKRLTVRFDTAKKNDVERLLRTEVNYTLNQATLDGYKDAGVNKYEFNATLDSRTSQICASLHGEKFDVSAIAVGINYPPMHPRCRSTTIPIIDYESLVKQGRDEIGEKELTPDEESAIMRYIGSDSYKINEPLRNGIELTQDQKEWVEVLDRALEKMPVYEGEVTRSLSFQLQGKEALQKFLDSYKTGDIKTYKAYTSTTVGDTYNSNGEVQIKIISKTGRDIRKFNEGEQEILFERNKKFKIVRYEFYKGKHYLKMEELNE